MTYTPDSPLRATSTLSASQIFAALEADVPAAEHGNLRNYLQTLGQLCQALGLDFGILAAQWNLETGSGTSKWWRERKNPAGIGITGDPAQNAASQIWADGAAAAFGHVAHMVAYVWGNQWRTVWQDGWPEPAIADKRFQAPIDAGFNAASLRDLNGTWAVDPEGNYHGKLAARANRILDSAPGDGGPVIAKPKVLIVAGHQGIGDTGNPGEAARTPAIADAYVRALQELGFVVTRLPDRVNPGLDGVGRACNAWMTSTPGDVVMIDCHLEGGHTRRGCFGIIPNRTGLGTAIQVPQATGDLWENNALDRRLAERLIGEISSETGIPIRAGLRGPGLMDEPQTFVATQFGARLAMYAYTSPFVNRAVRLVIEHGNLGAAQDAAIIDDPAFHRQLERAIKRGFSAIYGDVITDPAEFANPQPPASAQTHVVNDVLFLAPGGQTVMADTAPTVFADAGMAATGPVFRKGHRFSEDQISHYVVGADGRLWVVLANVVHEGVDVSGSRFPALAFIDR